MADDSGYFHKDDRLAGSRLFIIAPMGLAAVSCGQLGLLKRAFVQHPRGGCWEGACGGDRPLMEAFTAIEEATMANTR